METKTFRKGQVIFHEGEAGDSMCDLYMGRVGVYANYGTDDQRLLTEYYPDQYFGEMGLLDHAPRSATAVALEDETCISFVTEDSFGEFFEKNPARVLMVMQQLSQNLRKRTKDYVEVCRTIHEQAVKEGNA
ncbi:MAG: cyclic nucleotide-binding domain-containing protein [Eubacteriales bacterium]|jgi:CRP-like cAMP-binding protein|nr:cyclic nucleotide-binding domain-containing protein [Oscillospiraceae bacterium]MBQ1578479.1 cyclic nucleotide-binding domain-containing protein [Oscillospiraceae bacterium]MBQ1792643.1 cyclic nucleotide-binding domain-containing protein [Oscillospiraceae bacterium]MBQ2071127.1 cyclic nucleotide-binding domain-containing protein [Oscillospiraceae bacterium]MBQ4017084.1 cyclic nucleotide-binding domain-containing protein [Oscillospiraceae bacterium]